MFKNMINLDQNLIECLDNNKQDDFTTDKIAQVMAVVEGQSDNFDWAWVLRLNGGRYAYLQGGCGENGWSDESIAWSYIEIKPLLAAQHALRDYSQKVYNQIMHQMREGKNKSWRTPEVEERDTEST